MYIFALNYSYNKIFDNYIVRYLHMSFNNVKNIFYILEKSIYSGKYCHQKEKSSFKNVIL